MTDTTKLLTREQIERWREAIKRKFVNEEIIDALCDMALSALSRPTKEENPASPVDAANPVPGAVGQVCCNGVSPVTEECCGFAALSRDDREHGEDGHSTSTVDAQQPQARASDRRIP